MDEDYLGGYAVETVADARRLIGENYPGQGFTVFGLLADWEKDTEPSANGWWHHLVKDAFIVILGEEGASLECM